MSSHETVLDAIFEDSLSDADVEEGEIEEDDQKVSSHRPMDVDPADGPITDLEEGEVVGEGLPLEISPDNAEASDQDAGRAPRRKKSKKKRSGKRARTVNVAQFVRETCARLQEKKHPLVWAAVKRLGVDGVAGLLKEVDVIEKCGGQMTNDGKRRRTPGGVMWNILRGRVDPTVYKEIMSQGNEVQKQKAKEVKETLKRHRMDVDEPDNPKRQKTVVKEVDTSVQVEVARGKQLGQTHRIKPAKKLVGVNDGPQRDDSLLPAMQLQKAWVEGIKNKENVGKVLSDPVSLPPVDTGVVKQGTVVGDLPEKKKPLPLCERLRVPVEYSDLVKEDHSDSELERQQVLSGFSDLAEETHAEDLRLQDAVTKSSAGFDAPVSQRQTFTPVLKGSKAVQLGRSKEDLEFCDLVKKERAVPPSASQELPVNSTEVNMEALS